MFAGEARGLSKSEGSSLANIRLGMKGFPSTKSQAIQPICKK